MEPKVLIVSADPAFAHQVESAVQGAGGRSLRCATGEEALTLAGERVVAVAVAEVELPGLSGWELSARLKALDDAPCVILVHRNHAGAAARSRESRVDVLLSRPLHGDELRALLQERLDGRVGGRRGRDTGDRSAVSLVDPATSVFNRSPDQVPALATGAVEPIGTYEVPALATADLGDEADGLAAAGGGVAEMPSIPAELADAVLRLFDLRLDEALRPGGRIHEAIRAALKDPR